MTGQARAWFNVSPSETNVPADDRASSRHEAIVVLVDAFAAVGGAQWIDSPGTGRYGTYFCDEVVPFVDGRFRTAAAASTRRRRQVVGRIRGDDHADAPARPVRRVRDPRG